MSGTSSSQTAGSVVTSINPNGSHSDTNVTVDYGTSRSYGSTTSSQDLGAVLSPVTFSVSLTSLAPSTIYHFTIVAANVDGTTTTSDATFTTQTPPPVSPRPLALAVAFYSATVSGSTLKIDIACSGGTAGSACTGPLTLRSDVSTAAKKIIKISAATRTKPKPKTITTTETVGAGTYSVTTSQSATVSLKLNATGMKLLAARYALPTTLTLGGTGSSTRRLTFSYPQITSPVSFTWGFGPRTITAQELGVSAVRIGAKVLLICHGATGHSPGALRRQEGQVRSDRGLQAPRPSPAGHARIETHIGDVGKVALSRCERTANRHFTRAA